MQVWSNPGPASFHSAAALYLLAFYRGALDVRVVANVTATERFFFFFPFFFFPFPKKIFSNTFLITIQAPINDKYSHPDAHSHYQILCEALLDDMCEGSLTSVGTVAEKL